MINTNNVIIEKAINANSKILKQKLVLEDELQYRNNTVIRLANTWNKMLDHKASRDDFLVSLRNYLLVFGTKLNLSEKIEEKKFGIDTDNGMVFARLELPLELEEKFVADTFAAKEFVVHRHRKNYNLSTNSYIRALTGHSEFKSIEQKLSVMGVLGLPKGHTALVCLPTGGGKSMVTQTLAYQYDGLTVVIVPTVSLALDQVRVTTKKIRNSNDEVFAYHGNLDGTEKEKMMVALEQGKAKLLFISPEGLMNNNRMRETIVNLNRNGKLNALIVDEAHIVPAWGSSFRQEYQLLEVFRKKLLKENSGLKTVLLSATYTDENVNILKSLFSEGDNWVEIRCDALRKEPRFITINHDSQKEKMDLAIDLVNKLPRPMIVYVDSPSDANQFKKKLMQAGYKNIQTFTGETKSKDRERLIDEWSADDFDLMIATSAFGVGVDKPDVRTVLHLYISQSPDIYYQELGRGGRDGRASLSVINVCYEDDIESVYKKFEKVLTTERIIGRLESMNIQKRDRFNDLDLNAIPKYAKENNILSETNDKHFDWNVNAVLLLRRHGLLKIHDAYFSDIQCEKLVVEFNNNLILYAQEHEIQERDALIEKIREKEKNNIYKQAKLMRELILHKDECKSEIFEETYTFVHSCCAGCGEHTEANIYSAEKFPLKRSVLEQPLNRSKKLCLGDYKDFSDIVIHQTASLKDLAEKLSNVDIDVLITDCHIPTEDLSLLKSKKLNVITFDELTSLNEVENEKNQYFIRGTVMILYSNDVNLQLKEFRNVSRFLNKKDMNLIHVIHNDEELPKYSKKLSSMIDADYDVDMNNI